MEIIKKRTITLKNGQNVKIMIKMTTSKNGYITEIRNENDNLVSEITIRGSLYKYNLKYKTYNSVGWNELLHESSLIVT